MSYGIEVSNSSGEVVFNTDDPVFQVVGKGTITLSTYLSGRTIRYSTDPDYNAPGSTRSETTLYKNDDAIGDWDEDILTLLEVKSGEKIYRYETFTHPSGRRYLQLMSYGVSSVRYVQVRMAKNMTAPTSGFGMAVYDANGDTVWSSQETVLDNVKPLSDTSTSNKWFYWTPTLARLKGSLSPCGIAHYRGIIGGSSSFTKEATNFAYYGVAASAFRDTRFCGLSWDNSTRGFSANIDWNEV